MAVKGGRLPKQEEEIKVVKAETDSADEIVRSPRCAGPAYS